MRNLFFIILLMSVSSCSLNQHPEYNIIPSPTGNKMFKSDESKSYFARLREKAASNIYNSVNKIETGQVGLDFKIASNGELLSVIVDTEKTKCSPNTIKLILDGLKKASPFESFPSEIAKNKRWLDL